jgi:hypothetical protein
MDAALIDRIETGFERVASALFGGAVAFALYKSQPQLLAYALVAAAVAYVLSDAVLKRVTPRRPRFAVPVFDVREIERFTVEDELTLTDADRLGAVAELVLTDGDRLGADDELVLTDADRLGATVAEAGPLVLDDILAELGPDSRVVRLFDRKAMPTPGQLKSRIDDHLEQGALPAAPADASKALSDALAELRRSLR